MDGNLAVTRGGYPSQAVQKMRVGLWCDENSVFYYSLRFYLNYEEVLTIISIAMWKAIHLAKCKHLHLRCSLQASFIISGDQ